MLIGRAYSLQKLKLFTRRIPLVGTDVYVYTTIDPVASIFLKLKNYKKNILVDIWPYRGTQPRYTTMCLKNWEFYKNYEKNITC